MIVSRKADNVVDASYSVAAALIKEAPPSGPVLIKPNVVEPQPPPVTTDVRVVEGIVRAMKESGIEDIVIAEGSGSGDTLDNFGKLGWTEAGVSLMDLDRERTVKLPVKGHNVWKEIVIPEVLLDKFIVSVPVLKEHSLCGVTISMKNMVGILPAGHYSGYWTFKKSNIHKYDTDGCIADIISLVRPDWSVVDATVGMKGHHLCGNAVVPPINIVYGSTDPLEADIYGCGLLGRNWEEIRHIKLISGN